MKLIEMKKTVLNGYKWTDAEPVNFYRRSRWIKVRHNYNPGKNNSLWYYVTDGDGHQSGSESFNETGEHYLDYFIYNGKTYALNQFLSLGNPFYMPVNYGYEDKDGKLFFLSGVDSENYYKPIYIELDECCEYVRVYEEA